MYSVDELEEGLFDLAFAEDIGDGDHTTLCCIPEDAVGRSQLSGRVRSLLQTERLMLNVMQRMSGIATMTRRYMDALKGTKTRVLDTRKTTPGMRVLEKEAVRIGGGVNHRMGLFDMILLKDNHVDFAGGIAQALERCHEYLEAKGLDLKIEIEVRSFDELNTVLRVGGVDRIMLDFR